MESVPLNDFRELQKEVNDLKDLLQKKIFPKQRLLNQIQTCHYLKRSPGTINKLVKMGEIKQVIEPSIDGKEALPKYDIRDLDDYIERHTMKEVKMYERSK